MVQIKKFDTKLKEKCGVVAVWTSGDHAGHYARRGLAALQHRGQESAGLSILNPKGHIVTHKDMGLVPHVLTEDVLKKLGKSHAAIGHNRYGTSGRSSLDNAQPIMMKKGDFQLSIGHNGNIPDVSDIRKKVGGGKTKLSDTALIAAYLIQERHAFENWEETISYILPQFKGAYCLSILTNDGSLFGVRDPYGIRPLCLGKFNDGWIIASESVALDAIGAEFIRDVQPGEILKIDSQGILHSYFFGEPRHSQFCIFELIYFARPDSFLNGKRVREGREESGRLLGKRLRNKHLKPDVVVPTFDSGYPAAKGVAKELGLPIVDAITTSHYIGRTFIQPGQENRIAAVTGKHNIIPDEIRGKKVVIVDDSAVRLTTSTILAKGFRQAGAKEIYMAFASPPVVEHCDLGIDMRSKKELPASEFVKFPFEEIEKKVAQHINADAAVYLPIEETAKAMGGKKEDFYYFLLGGPHPIRGEQQTVAKLKKNLQGKPKICIFISGRGTFMQDIIEGIENGDIDAEIVAVVSNKPDAPGLARATKHHLPTTLIPYEKNVADKKARITYDEQLITYIKKLKPDIILLSNWQLILGDTFLKEMQKLQIPVINHHPAILTSDNSQTVATSKGYIPVMRGGSVWKETFDKKLPTSGITVHQVLPGDNFDVGPVIMTAEVSINPTDTIDTWRKKMDITEHMLLPAAIKRVLHHLQHGVDVSKGDFRW